MLANLKAQTPRLVRKQRGLTTVEYAVAGALISLAVIAAFTLLGGNVAAVITQIAGYLVVPGA